MYEVLQSSGLFEVCQGEPITAFPLPVEQPIRRYVAKETDLFRRINHEHIEIQQTGRIDTDESSSLAFISLALTPCCSIDS